MAIQPGAETAYENQTILPYAMIDIEVID